MTRTTALAIATVAALATTATPALADEITYEEHTFTSNPREGEPEEISLEVPADWDRQRLNRVTVGFFGTSVMPQTIVADLDPLSDTVREMRAEAKTLRDLGKRYYREFDFGVNDEDDKVRVRWVFAYRDAQTDDTWSYTSIFLMGDDRLEIDGRLKQKEQMQEIRRHVVASYQG